MWMQLFWACVKKVKQPIKVSSIYLIVKQYMIYMHIENLILNGIIMIQDFF